MWPDYATFESSWLQTFLQKLPRTLKTRPIWSHWLTMVTEQWAYFLPKVAQLKSINSRGMSFLANFEKKLGYFLLQHLVTLRDCSQLFWPLFATKSSIELFVCACGWPIICLNNFDVSFFLFYHKNVPSGVGEWWPQTIACRSKNLCATVSNWQNLGLIL